jgi:hypothetical protein
MLLAFGSSLLLHTINEYDVLPDWPSFTVNYEILVQHTDFKYQKEE